MIKCTYVTSVGVVVVFGGLVGRDSPTTPGDVVSFGVCVDDDVKNFTVFFSRDLCRSLVLKWEVLD